jgi:uncharacterized membrane protein
MLKILGIVSRWVFILCLPVMLFTASVAWGFNSLWIYNYGFQKFEVSQSTGIPVSELDRTAQGFISYLNSDAKLFQIIVNTDDNTFPLFTAPEQQHLKDVKGLVRFDYEALIGTFSFCLIFGLLTGLGAHGRWRRLLAKSLIWGSGLTLLILLILTIASLFDFEQLFIQLHYLIFTNLDWSAPGYMLKLFGDLWFDAALICFAFMAGLALILGGLGIGYLVGQRRSVKSSLRIDNDAG